MGRCQVQICAMERHRQGSRNFRPVGIEQHWAIVEGDGRKDLPSGGNYSQVTLHDLNLPQSKMEWMCCSQCWTNYSVSALCCPIWRYDFAHFSIGREVGALAIRTVGPISTHSRGASHRLCQGSVYRFSYLRVKPRNFEALNIIVHHKSASWQVQHAALLY